MRSVFLAAFKAKRGNDDRQFCPNYAAPEGFYTGHTGTYEYRASLAMRHGIIWILLNVTVFGILKRTSMNLKTFRCFKQLSIWHICLSPRESFYPGDTVLTYDI